MRQEVDNIDRRLLHHLQKDASLSVDALADLVGLSRNACWRRVKHMEHHGVITARVALLDPDKLGCGLAVLVMIRTDRHDATAMETLQKAVNVMPEITGAYRMSGDLDYVLRVRVADVAAYDAFYKRLISKVTLSDISASFVMENIKDTTALPL